MGLENFPPTLYLLDTSALIAYLSNEGEAYAVTKCLQESAIPFMALSELYYLTWAKKGQAEADFIYGIVLSWKLPTFLPNERVILTAGRLKAQYRMGIADSYIAAMAIEGKLLLVTKDKDFQAVEKEVKVHWIGSQT